ncbi:MAG: hypothetical protein ACTSWX_04475 [Promethearchaeota archaeon]
MKTLTQKKHILNLSLLFLFLILFSVNFTFSLNINNKNGIDKENYTNLSPDLIVKNPKNADFSSHLDFMPYGTYIYAPKYIQRFVNQIDENTIFFRLYDANGGDFVKFRVLVDGNLIKTEDWVNEYRDFNIAAFLTSEGVHNITAQALSRTTNEWITHNSILNVTPTKPCISPFYEDFMHSKDNNYGSLDWYVYTYNSSYNYSIYINDIKVQSENMTSYEYISIDYSSYSSFNNNLDEINEIRLEVKDQNGEETINQFNITNVDNNYPDIKEFDRNCNDRNDLTLWETEGFKIKVSAYSSSGDLDKIILIANNLPIITIDNATNNKLYEIPINTNIFGKLIDENNNYNTYLEIRAIAVTDYGKHSEYDSSPSQNFNFKTNKFDELIQKTKEAYPGRNIETIEMEEEENSNIRYSLTVATDIKTTTTLTIAASTANPWENNYGCDHNIENTDDMGDCRIFGEFEKDHNWYKGGIVFWVSAENITALNFPIIAKIVYPEEIHPDGINKIWNLQFMHWIDNCETGERGWYIYKNESITSNRDETLKKVGDNAIEVLLYSQGLYAFGIEKGSEGNNNRGFFIPGFPIGLMLLSFGIVSISLSNKINSKVRKK